MPSEIESEVIRILNTEPETGLEPEAVVREITGNGGDEREVKKVIWQLAADSRAEFTSSLKIKLSDRLAAGNSPTNFGQTAR